MRIFYVILIISLLQSKWICADDELRVVYASNNAPFSWLDNNVPRGLFIDIVEEVAVTRLHLSVSHRIVPWGRAQYMVENNQADGLVANPALERQKVMNMGKVSFVSLNIVMMTNVEHPQIVDLRKIDNLKKLEPFRVGIQLGSRWAKTNLPGKKFVETRSMEQLMKMAMVNRVDVIVHAGLVLEYFRKNLGYTEKITRLSHPLAVVTQNLFIGKNSKYTDLTEKFDQVLQEMQNDGSLEKIIAQYRW